MPFYVLLIYALLGIFSQETHYYTEPVDHAPETHKISGVVIDSNSSEFLAGVKVILDDSDKITYTNLDGEFELDVNSGVHKISVNYLSYESVEIVQSFSSHSENVVISLKEK